MKTTCSILACETLRREIEGALAAECLGPVEHIAFPCDCAKAIQQRPSFEEVLSSAAQQADPLLVLGCPCFLTKQPPEIPPAIRGKITRTERTFDLFLPGPLVDQYLAQGAYLLTPGWLEHWRERVSIWGFDPAAARSFFSESCARLVLLDTGTLPNSAELLAAMAAFVDRPFEIVPVGLDILRLFLKSHLTPPAALATPAKETASGTPTADDAMIFDMLGRLAGFQTEAQVAATFFEIFSMICAPATQGYLPLHEGQPAPLLTPEGAPPLPEDLVRQMMDQDQAYAWSTSETGFVLRLQREDRVLGVLLVEQIALPQHKKRYLNTALTLLPVLALAVSNARNFEQLAQSKETLREREERLSITLHSIGDAVLTTDHKGLVTFLNPVAEKLTGWKQTDAAGRPLSEVFHIINARTREPAPDPVQHVLETGLIVGLANHTVLIARDGTERQIADSAAPIRDSQGAIMGVILVFHDVTENYRLQESVEASEQKFRLIAETFTDMIFQINPRGELTYCSPSMSKVLGYAPEEMAGTHFGTYIAPESMKEASEAFSRTLQGQPARFVLLHGIRKSGEIIWLEINAAPIQKEGVVSGVQGVARDITERARMEQALRDSEERLNKAQEIAHLGSWVLETSTSQLHWSDEVYRIFGFQPQEFQATYEAFLSAVHPEDRAAVDAAYSNSLKADQDVYEIEHRVLQKSGEIRTVLERCEHVKDAGGRVVRSVGMVQDITERRKEQASLRKLARAVEQSPATVVITDLAGAIEYANPKFTETTGYTFEEARGQNPRILKSGEMPPDNYKQLWDTITAGNEWHGEFHNKRKDGTLYWEFASISPIRDGAGKITHFLAVKEDITERKSAEEKMKENVRKLMQLNKLMMGREDRVLELKKEINDLMESAGKPRRYKIT